MTAMEGKLNLLVAELDLLEANRPQNFAQLAEQPMLQRGLIKTIENAIEYCLDLGRMLIRLNGWETPERYRDIVTTLTAHGVLPADKLNTFYSIVGFRNLAVHNYEKMDVEAVYSIVTKHVEDLRLFGRAVAAAASKPEQSS
jgi:uncharacterized protein YutE (UPF0331/DUF86 family)